MKLKTLKPIAYYLLCNMLLEILLPNLTYAISGPTQPEVQSFSPIGSNEMVDPFSGDFSYNIPLIDVGGYPINLAYQSGISMEQEASWVGLGWNINPGAIVRNLRGIPDDFNGDKVIKEFNIKSNQTYGVTFSPDAEIFGAKLKKIQDKISLGINIQYNKYTGIGTSFSLNPAIAQSKLGGTPFTAKLGINLSSENGTSFSPTLSFEEIIKDKNDNDVNINAELGLGYNSRSGLADVSYNSSITKTFEKTNKKNELVMQTKSFNGGSTISFANPTYTPQITMPKSNVGFSTSFKVGGEVFGLNISGNMSVYFSGQYLQTTKSVVSGYGYLFSHEGVKRNQDMMLDFNRERDGSYNEELPNLPLTNMTYDLFSVSGQGVSGSYRAHRSDIGVVYDAAMTSKTMDLKFPLPELGGGNLVKAGINWSADKTTAESGKWESIPSAYAGFKGKGTSTEYEPYYFKQVGEKVVDSENYRFDVWGGFDAVRLSSQDEKVFSSLSETKVLPKIFRQKYISGSGVSENYSDLVTDYTKDKRQPRNQFFSFYNATDAALFGVVKNIPIYGDNDFTTISQNNDKYISYDPLLTEVRTVIKNEENISKNIKHHMSEMSVTRNDGVKYIYGIPAYNKLQQDVTFSVEGGQANRDEGTVTYSPGSDNSLGNNQGINHYFDRVTLPPFAHSYLLTNVLSSDYVDLTGNGPTDDDFGSFTKFNYSRIKDFKWRVPFTEVENIANYNPGTETSGLNDSKTCDDQASYIYGVKDVWYMHSIETKTHVAEFELENRHDGYGAKGENGGRASSNPLKALKEIRLYTKQEKLKEINSAGSYTAIPIKVVHFEYDYSLCPNTPTNDKIEEDNNESKGKLTLTKVYFTYGNSNRAIHDSYSFSYGQKRNGIGETPEIINPAYSFKAADRWGSYKNQITSIQTSEGASTVNSTEFPYTDQKLADKNAFAWNLTAIELPSNGQIHVDYEADDYAYVQDKRAMQMFLIDGFAQNASVSSEGNLSHDLYGIPYMNDYMYIKLDEPVPASLATQNQLNKYFKDANGNDMQYLAFRARVKITDNFEYVPGYVEFTNKGFASMTDANSNITHIWVKLKSGTVSGGLLPPVIPFNPISVVSMNYTLRNLPRIAYNQTDPGDNSLFNLFKSILKSLTSVSEMISGIYNSMAIRGVGNQINIGKSYARLYNPGGNKKGGGIRVKEIRIYDQWKEMAGGLHNTNYYGQRYNYTTKDALGNTISSGVAEYEPIVGKEESPFSEPIFVKEEYKMAPDISYYIEKPIGQSFFPSPSVGYSKVTITSIAENDVKKHATGAVVNEFYTAKDFPVYVKETPLLPLKKTKNKLKDFLNVNTYESMSVFQGYSIVLNDMHGKPKSNKVYRQPDATKGETYNNKTLISSVEYQFKRDNDGKLSHTALTINDKGEVRNAVLGLDFDIVVDSRSHKTTTESAKRSGNVDSFLAAIFPVVIPVAIPGYVKDESVFNSAVVTKTIRQYGILEKTEVMDLGSKIATSNLLYDANSGEVVLTETQNQFNDKLYNFSYPAYWMYPGMAQSYLNQGIQLTGQGNYGAYLVPGDEVYTNNKRAWVTAILGNSVTLKDNQGENVTPTEKLTVLKSGHKNIQSASAGGVFTKVNPLSPINGGYELVFTNVLNASAIEFTDKRNMYCECNYVPGTKINRYAKGLLGNWRPDKSYVYQTGRTQSNLNNNVNLREDGVYTGFSTFWKYNGLWSKQVNNWDYTTEITVVDPHGMELENRDPLNRYSSAIYSYNYMLPIAVSSNANYAEVGVENFEAFGFTPCASTNNNGGKEHFSYDGVDGLGNDNFVTDEVSHSGRHSLKVSSEIVLRKVIQPCK